MKDVLLLYVRINHNLQGHVGKRMPILIKCLGQAPPPTHTQILMSMRTSNFWLPKPYSYPVYKYKITYIFATYNFHIVILSM